MTDKPSLTEQLATFLTATCSTDLPPAVVDAARYFTLDWLGTAMAGTTAKPGQMLLDYGVAQGDGPATIVGLAQKRSPEVAALANGGLAHVVEMDDLHRASVLHPAAPVISAAMAVAEQQKAGGVDFLTAVVLGYEVAIRIGEAVGQSHYHYWHNTATCGTFGAAAAAGWLRGLSAEEMTWALGNAGTMAAGLWEFNTDGAMSKALHPGRTAANGILAAELAGHGFTGARHILEGERGFFTAMSQDADPAHVVANLSPGMSNYRITGVSIKPHASCRHTHPAVDAALAVRLHPDFKREAITEVTVDTYQAALALTSNPAPTHSYAAKFSLPYCVATTLWRGRAGLADFSLDAIADDDVRALMTRVKLHHSAEIEAHYPAQWSTQVTVKLEDGCTLTEFIDFPKGDPENPLSWEELEAKFQIMVAATDVDAEATALIKWVHNLSDVEQLGLPRLIVRQ